MLTLANEMGNESAQSFVRNAAGLAFKNALTGRESVNTPELTARWRETVDPSTKQAIKTTCLQTLASADRKAGSVAAQAVSAIASIELPSGEWPDLIGNLLSFVGQENVNLRIATLQAVGFICEVVPPATLASRSNEILTAVVQGARKEETSAEVQAAAIQALYNSLEFIRDNFSREGERNYIMQVVCEATQSPSIPVQVGAFECLVRIMQLYYNKMGLYMEKALFGLTVLGMQNPEEKVALQAVEFWSTVCDEEAELAIEAAEAAEWNEAPIGESKHFARTALPEILPVMLTLLQRQDEDAEEDEWNVSMAAGTCVGLLANVVGDSIVPLVIPFIESNIQSADWRQRDAAVMVFGSILDGPDEDKLAPLVKQALPTLINMMRDSHPVVKDTVAWTLGRITDLMSPTIDPDVHLPELVKATAVGLQESGRIASNACWSIKNLASAFGADDGAPTSPLSPYYQGLLDTLMRSTEQRQSNEGNSRTAAYEAIADLAYHSAQDTMELVSQVGIQILSRMEKLNEVHNQLVGLDDRTSWNELQSSCSNVIQAIIRKVGVQIAPLSDRIMTILLQLLRNSAKDAAVAEDAFMTITTLVNALDADFEKYVPHLIEFVYGALQVLDEFQVYIAAVGCICDIARAIGPKISPYAPNLLSALLTALASPVLHRTAKPTVVAAFGDMATALGPEFSPYLPDVMSMLNQAGQVQADVHDEAMTDFVWEMRQSIVDAYTGILGAYQHNPAPFAPYVAQVIPFLIMTTSDEFVGESYLRNSLGLLGDLASSYGSGIKEQLLQPGVSRMLTMGKARPTKQTTQATRYARKAVKEATA